MNKFESFIVKGYETKFIEQLNEKLNEGFYISGNLIVLTTNDGLFYIQLVQKINPINKN